MPKKTKSKKTELINANRLAEEDVIKFGGNDYLVIHTDTAMFDRNEVSIYAAGFATLIPGQRPRLTDDGTLYFKVPKDTPFTVLK